MSLQQKHSHEKGIKQVQASKDVTHSTRGMGNTQASQAAAMPSARHSQQAQEEQTVFDAAWPRLRRWGQACQKAAANKVYQAAANKVYSAAANKVYSQRKPETCIQILGATNTRHVAGMLPARLRAGNKGCSAHQYYSTAGCTSLLC